jgi:hypothetical protein
MLPRDAAREVRCAVRKRTSRDQANILNYGSQSPYLVWRVDFMLQFGRRLGGSNMRAPGRGQEEREIE